jgi:hypothetical protein
MPLSISDSGSDSEESSGTLEEAPRKSPSTSRNAHKHKWDSRARQRDIAKLQRLLNRDKKSRRRIAVWVTENCEELVREMQAQCNEQLQQMNERWQLTLEAQARSHAEQLNEVRSALQNVHGHCTAAHNNQYGYLHEQSTEHGILHRHVMTLEDDLQKMQQQVESQAGQRAAGSNHPHAAFNHLNTGLSSSLFYAGSRTLGMPVPPYMHPADTAFDQASPAALPDHPSNVSETLYIPARDHFIAPFAGPQLQRATTPPEQHASLLPYANSPRSIAVSERHAKSYSYKTWDGRQGSDAAVSESDDSSVTMAGDGSIGGASPTYEPASSVQVPTSPTHESPLRAHDGGVPTYNAVTQGTVTNTLYTQLDQWGGWPVSR